MTKAKKVDLKSFIINQVNNGWLVEANTHGGWYLPETKPTSHVFTDLDDLLVWIEANI